MIPEEAKPVLCGNTFERDGGVFGCVLPAGHAGPHELLSSKRARKLPQNFGARLQGRALRCFSMLHCRFELLRCCFESQDD